jgi:hypothetical protein
VAGEQARLITRTTQPEPEKIVVEGDDSFEIAGDPSQMPHG